MTFFEVLDARGFDVKLVEPGKLKSVPGRKTDVLDCPWIQRLHTYGLLQGSFVPTEEISMLRSYMRQRGMLVGYAGQHVLHMQKALMQMKVQLHHVIRDITGATGLRIIDAILAGERDPIQLAKLRDPRGKKDQRTIALALKGHGREDHLFALKQALGRYRFYHRQLAELDGRLEAYLTTFEDRSDGTIRRKSPKPKAGSNAPNFDIGTNMPLWPTEKHFASWLCLCPGNKKTGGRLISGKSRANANRAAAVLRLAAQSLARANCALGAFYRRMKARLGAPKAITATAHKLAKIVYNMLRHGKQYVDRGVEYYERQYRQRVLKSLERRAAQFKLCLTPIATPQGETAG